MTRDHLPDADDFLPPPSIQTRHLTETESDQGNISKGTPSLRGGVPFYFFPLCPVFLGSLVYIAIGDTCTHQLVLILTSETG